MVFVFFFKQKTAYEMRISDWSSDVCSSDLNGGYRQCRTRVENRTLSLEATEFQLQPAVGEGAVIPAQRRRRGDDFGRLHGRSEERRVGKEWSVRVDLGGRRIIKQKKNK